MAQLGKPRISPALGRFLPRPRFGNPEFPPHLGGFARGPASETPNFPRTWAVSPAAQLRKPRISPALGPFLSGLSFGTPEFPPLLGGCPRGPASETPNFPRPWAVSPAAQLRKPRISPALGRFRPRPSFGNPEEFPPHLGGCARGPASETPNFPRTWAVSPAAHLRKPRISPALGRFRPRPSLGNPKFSPNLIGLAGGPDSENPNFPRTWTVSPAAQLRKPRNPRTRTKTFHMRNERCRDLKMV